jgi:hypothetical protein
MDFSQMLRDQLSQFKSELLQDLEDRLAQHPSLDPDQFIDNAQFMQLLRIAPRTAQKIRSSNLIPYAQIGRKVYYKMTDVVSLIESHYRRAYSDLKNFQRRQSATTPSK